jgi:hypothetical protein
MNWWCKRNNWITSSNFERRNWISEQNGSGEYYDLRPSRYMNNSGLQIRSILGCHKNYFVLLAWTIQSSVRGVKFIAPSTSFVISKESNHKKYLYVLIRVVISFGKLLSAINLWLFRRHEQPLNFIHSVRSGIIVLASMRITSTKCLFCLH